MKTYEMFPSPNLGLSLKCDTFTLNPVEFWFPSPNLGLSLKLKDEYAVIWKNGEVFRPLIWGYL